MVGQVTTGNQEAPAIRPAAAPVSKQAATSAGAQQTTADKLTSTPDLVNKLVPRSVPTMTTAETLLSTNTPLDNLLADGAPAARIDTQATTSLEVEGLGHGSRGPEVHRLQRDLQRAGYAPGTADSIFGNMTLGSVQNFQRDRIATLDAHLAGGLPPRERSLFQAQKASLQVELDNNVAGAETVMQLRRVIAASIPAGIPVNTDLQVNSDGFVNNDPRIVPNRVPQLERSAFADPVADIDNVVLHRTVTNTADQALGSFATPRNGVHYGTHFLIGRDGGIQQTASLNNRTNHVAGHNSSSIGIEVVGMPLDKDGNQTIGPPNGNPVASWEALTPEQTEAVAYLANSLNSYYGLGSDTVEVHEDLAAKTAGEGATVYNAIEDLLAP